MFAPVSIKLTTNGRPLTLHLFSTGKIAGRLSSRWQPIWVLAIDHPEGIFLVDAGERTRRAHWWLDVLYKFDLDRSDEADRQLANFNIGTHQVKTILLTHRHFDHTDGLCHFPQTPVFHPSPKTLNDSCGAFTKAHYVTAAKDLIVVSTPGHTRDHCSVLLRTDNHHVLFAGDMAETQEQLLQGNHPTYSAVKAYAHSHPLIFLPTHDPASGTRLATLQALNPDNFDTGFR
ncbi:MAG TPA: MBL fold metallo-hydrolase [Puia sp.]|nr:MBL fold metallo-hydrolase [Puia sp.]